MTEKENQCTGSYPVSGYTRDDGVEVDSYIRTCWKHGSKVLGNVLLKNSQSSIEKLNKNIDTITKQKEVSNKDVYESYKSLFEIINDICILSSEIILMRSQLPSTITLGRIEQAGRIEKLQKELKETTFNVLMTINNIQKVSEKNWAKVDSDSKDYCKKLNIKIERDKKTKEIHDIVSDLYTVLGSNDENKIQNVINFLQKSHKDAGIIADTQKELALELHKDNNFIPFLNNRLYPEEKEYYAYFLNKAQIDTKNNEKFTVKDIENDNLKKFIYSKYSDINNNTTIIKVKEHASLYKKINKSEELKTKIVNFYTNNNIRSDQIVKMDINFTQRPISNVIGKGVIYIDGIYNDHITGYIVDYYDFDKIPWDKISKNINKYDNITELIDDVIIIYANNNAVKQQKVYGTKYILLVPIKIYKKDL